MSCLVLGLVAHTASAESGRLRVEEQVVIPVPATAVWDIVGDFGACQDWHPEITRCAVEGGSLPGAIRTMTLENGATISQKLLMYNSRDRKLMYRINGMSQIQVKQGDGKARAIPALPVRRYRAWLKVGALPDGTTRVSWEAHFMRAYDGRGKAPQGLDALAATSRVRSFLQAGLEGLKRQLEQSFLPGARDRYRVRTYPGK